MQTQLRRRFMRRLPPQAPIPSQRPSQVPAYVSSGRADIVELRPFKQRAPDGYTRPEPYVITHYDARPINAIDFVETFTTAEQAGADSRTFNFVVPAGRVAVVRRLDLRVYMSDQRRDAVTGAPTAAITATFQIDGNAVDGANNFRVDDAICGMVTVGAGDSVSFTNGLSVPLYFLAPENSTVALIVTNATGGTDFAFVAPVLTGNLLLAEGVNPTSEPGTKAAVPVFAAHRMARPLVQRGKR